MKDVKGERNDNDLRKSKNRARESSHCAQTSPESGILDYGQVLGLWEIRRGKNPERIMPVWSSPCWEAKTKLIIFFPFHNFALEKFRVCGLRVHPVVLRDYVWLNAQEFFLIVFGNQMVCQILNNSWQMPFMLYYCSSPLLQIYCKGCSFVCNFFFNVAAFSILSLWFTSYWLRCVLGCFYLCFF